MFERRFAPLALAKLFFENSDLPLTRNSAGIIFLTRKVVRVLAGKWSQKSEYSWESSKNWKSNQRAYVHLTTWGVGEAVSFLELSWRFTDGEEDTIANMYELALYSLYCNKKLTILLIQISKNLWDFLQSSKEERENRARKIKGVHVWTVGRRCT